MDIIEEQKYFNVENLENLLIKSSDVERFDLDTFHIPSILYQAGYLSIQSTDGSFLSLSYPNREVRESFVNELLILFSRKQPEANSLLIYQLSKSIKSDNLDEFFTILKSYLARIPYDIQLPLEKYYQSMIYMICRLVSENYRAEVHTNTGRIDMLLETQDHVYIFEFKLSSSAKEALTQIREKKYYEQYLNTGIEIKLIGVNFSIQERNINEWIQDLRT